MFDSASGRSAVNGIRVYAVARRRAQRRPQLVSDVRAEHVALVVEERRRLVHLDHVVAARQRQVGPAAGQQARGRRRGRRRRVAAELEEVLAAGIDLGRLEDAAREVRGGAHLGDGPQLRLERRGRPRASWWTRRSRTTSRGGWWRGRRRGRSRCRPALPLPPAGGSRSSGPRPARAVSRARPRRGRERASIRGVSTSAPDGEPLRVFTGGSRSPSPRARPGSHALGIAERRAAGCSRRDRRAGARLWSRGGCR